jgi:hypothetical protein
MKTLAVVLLVVSACEHDPRYERHADRRPPPAAPAVAPEKTVERPMVDDPPAAPVRPKIVPFDKRTHRHRVTRARP